MSKHDRPQSHRAERERETDLDRLSRETRDVADTPRVDWDSVDAKLFARMKADADEKRRRGAHVMWLPIAGVLAAAAAVALLVGRGHDAQGPLFDGPTAQAEPAAGAVVVREGDGDLLVDGRSANAGTTIGAHSVVETRGGARALVERAGKVAFWVEPASRLVVTRTQGTLVLSLERGAVEAKVTPVAEGEAFAVDVGSSRVAVHGTQLRVARDGSNVVVDLSEGVVSIGVPPRFGSTQGDLVTAPAHAVFSQENAAATLKVDHRAISVRPAIAFAIPLPSTAAPPAVTVAVGPSPAPPAAPAPSGLSPTGGAAGAAGNAGAGGPKVEPTSSAPIPPAPPPPDPHAEITIARATHACLAARPPAPGVKLTVSTILELQMSDDGVVQLAHFDPPLAPDVQACATAAIYRVRFGRGGAVSIPIDHAYGD